MPFEEIDPSKPATFKQIWAVAYKFAESINGDYPDIPENKLVLLIRGTIYYYHQDAGTPLSHGEVQEFLANHKRIPEYYIEHLNNYLRSSQQ